MNRHLMVPYSVALFDLTHSTTEAGIKRQEYVTSVCCPGLPNSFHCNKTNSYVTMCN